MAFLPFREGMEFPPFGKGGPGGIFIDGGEHH